MNFGLLIFFVCGLALVEFPRCTCNHDIRTLRRPSLVDIARRYQQIPNLTEFAEYAAIYRRDWVSPGDWMYPNGWVSRGPDPWDPNQIAAGWWTWPKGTY